MARCDDCHTRKGGSDGSDGTGFARDLGAPLADKAGFRFAGRRPRAGSGTWQGLAGALDWWVAWES